MIIIILLSSYLIGSIPFGLLLTKLAGHGDIRAIGSGNIGATNVLRTGNKFLAFLTLLFDFLKGMFVVLFIARIMPPLAPFAGLAAMFGHLFPVWLKFKGGKGVATAVGILTALSWPVGVTAMVTWVVIIAVTRYSSLAALVTLVFAPASAYLFNRQDLMWICLVILCFVTGKHENNIKRLLKGTEPRVGQ